MNITIENGNLQYLDYINYKDGYSLAISVSSSVDYYFSVIKDRLNKELYNSIHLFDKHPTIETISYTISNIFSGFTDLKIAIQLDNNIDKKVVIIEKNKVQIYKDKSFKYFNGNISYINNGEIDSLSEVSNNISTITNINRLFEYNYISNKVALINHFYVLFFNEYKPTIKKDNLLIMMNYLRENGMYVNLENYNNPKKKRAMEEYFVTLNSDLEKRIIELGNSYSKNKKRVKTKQ